MWGMVTWRAAWLGQAAAAPAGISVQKASYAMNPGIYFSRFSGTDFGEDDKGMSLTND
jgi:hypothetical protein